MKMSFHQNKKMIRESQNISDKSVCFICESPSWGGAEKHTLEFVKILVDKGYYVEYVSCRESVLSDEYKKIDSRHLKIISTSLSIFEKESAYLWLEELKKLKIKSRIFIFQRLWFFHGSLEFLKCCRKYFDHVYFVEHTSPPLMPQKSSRRYLSGLIQGVGLWWHKERWRRKSYFKCADKIVTVSEDVGRQLVRECGWPCGRTIVARNGIDYRQFMTVRGNEDIKKEYHIPRDTVVFATLGRLSKEKGVDMALDAFKMFLESDPSQKACLVIIGVGKEEDSLKLFVTQHHMARNVRFVGFIENPEKVLSVIDFLIFPSRQEGLALSLMEGMAAGCLPIIFRVGGMPEVLAGTDIGWIVEPNDCVGLKDAMVRAMNTEEDLLSIQKKQAVEHIKQNFDAKKSYQRILDVFDLK